VVRDFNIAIVQELAILIAANVKKQRSVVILNVTKALPVIINN